MCGRFSLFARQNDVETRFGARFVGEYDPHYNAAPSQDLAVVPDVAPEEIHTAEWGLIPTWADDRDDGGHINARAESAAEKPSFRDAFAGSGTAEAESEDHGWATADAGRCLVPADGFYEWGDTGDGRRPYRIEVGDRDLFAMAGLWTRWEPTHRQTGLGEFAGETGDADPIHTFTILTTDANETLAPIHDRMPVILAHDEESAWLREDSDALRSLLDPYEGDMRSYAVSPQVNNPRNDTQSVIEPAEG